MQEWDALDEATKIEKTARAVVANPEDINLIMDLSLDKQTRVASLIKDICIKIGIKRDRIAAIVASPMCNTFTKLDHVNRELGHNFREAAKPYAPRALDGTAEAAAKRKVAQDHDNMVENLLQSILKDREEGFEYDFCIENPRALLRFRPYMIADAWMGVSSRCTADYCVFDHDYQKPTDLWHSFDAEWQPKGCTGDGKCHRKCGKGRYLSSGSWKHYKRHAGPAGSGVTGKDQMLQKWQIPHKLCEEVIQQVKQVEGKDVVLDLFSGGESYRKSVEAAGYIYVPIDLKTLSKDDGTLELLLSSAAGEVAAKRQQMKQKQE